MTALANRYDIVFLFDVTNGNPNGDPDAGNMPRMDPETNKGLVSDVALKRKIRNYTELTKGDQPGYRIYVQEGAILNEKHREAYKAVRGDTEKVKKDSKLNPQTVDESRALTKFMCDNFFDVRAFGAVMSLGINAGQVRGPVQVTFASSIETILPLEISITRMAVANQKEKAESRQGDDGDRRTENRTMGRKHIVPYAYLRQRKAGRANRIRRDRSRPSVRKSGIYVRSRSISGAGGDVLASWHRLQACLSAWQCPGPCLVRACPGAS